MTTWPKASSWGGTSHKMSTWPEVVSHLATRYLCLRGHGTSDQRSVWLKVWWNVNLTQGLTQGVHLTKGQPDPKSEQMSTWPKASSWGGTSDQGHSDLKIWWNVNLPKVVSHLATRCLCLGVHLTKGQPDPKDLRKIIIWQKCQPDPKPHLGGPSKCRKVIWKLEHTMRFRSCLTAVFYERPISKRNQVSSRVTEKAQTSRQYSI